jgi:ketosteroid isomerase-like protein
MMPVTTHTTRMTEQEIREAVVKWLRECNAGEGPAVSADDLVFIDDNGEPFGVLVSVMVDH